MFEIKKLHIKLHMFYVRETVKDEEAKTFLKLFITGSQARHARQRCVELLAHRRRIGDLLDFEPVEDAPEDLFAEDRLCGRARRDLRLRGPRLRPRRHRVLGAHRRGRRAGAVEHGAQLAARCGAERRRPAARRGAGRGRSGGAARRGRSARRSGGSARRGAQAIRRAQLRAEASFGAARLRRPERVLSSLEHIMFPPR